MPEDIASVAVAVVVVVVVDDVFVVAGLTFVIGGPAEPNCKARARRR